MSTDNPQAGSGRLLPKKEADLFRNVVKHYETKQYKKAIKQADAILKKFPKHGETLAMKGLTLNYMNNSNADSSGGSKKEEAHTFVKEGLMNDMRSHVCWHVYGLLHRSDHNYNEAIKAYKQALRIDPENLQILRDLSMLQIQMRDLDGFVVTRNTLLTLKPSLKINWMAFSLARHMAGDLREAVKVIDIYLGTLTEGSVELGRCFESSELALYKNSILAEIDDNYKEALEHLETCEGIVVDRGAWMMSRAEYQLKLRDFSAARQSVEAIFERGMTENYKVHSILMCVILEIEDTAVIDEALSLNGTQTLATLIPISSEQKAALHRVYTEELLPKFATSHAIQRIPFTLLNSNEELLKKLEERCRKDLPRGVPSLFAELCSYIWIERNGRYVRPIDPVEIKSHNVFKLLVSMVDNFIASLESCNKLSESDKDEQSLQTKLWTYYLRAGLHEVSAEYSEALASLDKCLEQNTDEVDVYEMKARLLKAAGDPKAAVDALNKARELDKQDRYINNQTTRYMLQAGMEDEALKVVSLFTRHEGNAEQNLYDMQCSWFELEFAACMFHKGEYGRSLKKYACIVKHFDDFNEDQFDFHAYCLRKVTLRSYVSVLRYEDNVYGQEYFCEAAEGIVSIYLHLFNNPTDNGENEPDYSNMSAAERKKAKNLAKKKKKAAEKKEAAQLESKENGNGKKSASKNNKPSFIDEDPRGQELLKLDPLVEANKYVSILSKHAPKSLTTWILQYDVAIRRKKYLMALQALYKANAIQSDSSKVFSRIVHFALQLQSTKIESDVVQQVISDTFSTLMDNKTLDDYVKSAANSVKADPLEALPMRTAVAEALLETKSGTIDTATSLITNGGLNGKGVDRYSVVEAAEALRKIGSEASTAHSDWVKAVKDRFPLLQSKALQE